MSKRQKQCSQSPQVESAPNVSQGSGQSCFERRDDVREFLSKIGIGKEEQSRLAKAIELYKEVPVFKSDLARFRRTVNTMIITFMGEEIPEWVDGYIGSIYDELTSYGQERI